MDGITRNDLLQAVLDQRPVAPPYPDWMTAAEIGAELKLNGNQTHTRLLALIRAGKVEKKRGPRRMENGAGVGGTVTYYHFRKG